MKKHYSHSASYMRSVDMHCGLIVLCHWTITRSRRYHPDPLQSFDEVVEISALLRCWQSVANQRTNCLATAQRCQSLIGANLFESPLIAQRDLPIAHIHRSCIFNPLTPTVAIWVQL